MSNNKISGKIILKDVGIQSESGIKGLTVTIFDADPYSINPDEPLYLGPYFDLSREAISNIPKIKEDETDENSKSEGIQADRLGSIITDEQGYFELSYPDEAFNFRKKQKATNLTGGHDPNSINKSELRPDIFLVVTTPEASEVNGFSNVVYHSHKIRVNAGRNEEFLIQLSAEELNAAGYTIPVLPAQVPTLEPTPPPTFREQLNNTLLEKYNKRKDIKAVYAHYLNLEREAANVKKETFTDPFCKSISQIPENLRNNSRLFLNPQESVTAKTSEVIQYKIKNVFNNPEIDTKKRGVIHLTEDQIKRFIPQDTEESEILIQGDEAEDFLKILINGSGENPSELHMDHPLDLICQTLSDNDIKAEIVLGIREESEYDIHPDSDTQVIDFEPASSENIPLYISRQIERAVSPENPVIFGISDEQFLQQERANQKIVEGSINSLSLRQGPADTTAFYDFHRVQIAFEPIWQEVLDSKTVKIAEDIYDRIVDFGGSLQEGSLKELKTAVNLQKQFKYNISDLGMAVPVAISLHFGISAEVWDLLSRDDRTTLRSLASDISQRNDAIDILVELFQVKYEDNVSKNGRPEDYKKVTGLIERQSENSLIENILLVKKRNTEYDQVYDVETKTSTLLIRKFQQEINDRYEQAVSIISTATEELNQDLKLSTSGNGGGFQELLKELEERFKMPYSFKTYAANDKERSINFGIILTYRQKWEPQSYQAGELIKTIPLAPKEIKKFSKKEVVKKKRNVKEVENSLRIIKEDTSEKGRAESEIMDKAVQKTNFTLNTNGKFNVGFFKEDLSTSSAFDNSQDSSKQKKNFRESVKKAAQEYKSERKLEITTEETFDSTFTESGEISNPNDELTVTYLFYELQRRYKVFERIHRAQAVIFVAQEMPKPEDIDEDWVLAHDWILRRVLLDDSFLPALNYVGNSLVGMEVSLQQTRENIKLQRSIVGSLKGQLVALKNAVNQRYRTFEAAVDKQANIIGSGSDSGSGLLGVIPDAVDAVSDFLFGDDDEGNPEEAARIRREAAMSAYEKAARDRDTMIAQLEREMSSLNAITERYNQKISEYLNTKTKIKRLLVHIKENILYYMQAIWSYEPEDQRFFRLFNTQVPDIQSGRVNFILKPQTRAARNPFTSKKTTTYAFEADPNYSLDFHYKTLEEVADLENLLGFKGNYMIFPLKQSNQITDYMMMPYMDNLNNMRDPDHMGEWSLEDFSQYVCCLKESLAESDFQELVDELKATYLQLITDPQRRPEEIVVPTGSLFIEALPGTHPILEDFKLAHRAIDVKKVQAEVRELELENIRLAARLLEGERDDPDVEKKIVVEGNLNGVNVESV